MITIIVLIIRALMVLVPAQQGVIVTTIIPPMPQTAPVVVDQDAYEWSEFHADAVTEYAAEFTALFNTYEIKRAKNGALMIRSGNRGSYTFAKKGSK